MIKPFYILMIYTLQISVGNKVHGYFGKEDLLNFVSQEYIQQTAGHDVKLKCGVRNNQADFMTAFEVKWFFKPCGNSLNQSSCHSAGFTNWTNLQCNDNPCKLTYHIKNATAQNSGLYKCQIKYKPNIASMLEIQVVNVYQLAVISFIILAPEFLDDYPENTTAEIGSPVVLQCKVQSRVPAIIKWFRFRSEETPQNLLFNSEHPNSRLVQYSNKTYEPLESQFFDLTEDTYLSKLILNGITEIDSRFYVCVAINYGGHRIRGAYLEVIEAIKISDPSEFILLFLMPLGLAMIPLSLWLCFVISKRWSRRKEVTTEENHLKETSSKRYMPVRTNTTPTNVHLNKIMFYKSPLQERC